MNLLQPLFKILIITHLDQTDANIATWGQAVIVGGDFSLGDDFAEAGYVAIGGGGKAALEPGDLGEGVEGGFDGFADGVAGRLQGGGGAADGDGVPGRVAAGVKGFFGVGQGVVGQLGALGDALLQAL